MEKFPEPAPKYSRFTELLPLLWKVAGSVGQIKKRTKGSYKFSDQKSGCSGGDGNGDTGMQALKVKK